MLLEVKLGNRVMLRAGNQTWDEVYACHFVVDIEGWRVTLYHDCDELDYCEECVSPDGRRWTFDTDRRLGTDPVAQLSVWEHQKLEGLLKTI